MIKRQYVRVPDGNGGRGRPIGVVLMDRSDPTSINVGFALCAEEDTFSKEIANRIATGRLQSGKYRINEGQTPKEILQKTFGSNSSMMKLLPILEYMYTHKVKTNDE